MARGKGTSTAGTVPVAEAPSNSPMPKLVSALSHKLNVCNNPASAMNSNYKKNFFFWFFFAPPDCLFDTAPTFFLGHTRMIDDEATSRVHLVGGNTTSGGGTPGLHKTLAAAGITRASASNPNTCGDLHTTHTLLSSSRPA